MALKKRQRAKKSKAEFFQEAARQYMALHGVTAFDPEDVADWMVETKQYEEAPRSIISRCKQELVKSLRASAQPTTKGATCGPCWALATRTNKAISGLFGRRFTWPSLNTLGLRYNSGDEASVAKCYCMTGRRARTTTTTCTKQS